MIDKQITDYTNNFTSDEPEIIKRLVKSTKKHLEFTDTICGKQVGWTLRFLVSASKAKRILEVGTFTGYSALMMALELPPDGELITLEINKSFQKISEPYFSVPPFQNIIKQTTGDALHTIPGLTGKFDFIFLDADKVNYPNYYPMLKNRLNIEGLLVIDNVLWGGAVLDADNEKAAAIHSLNNIIANDNEVENVMLPVRDGLTIVRRKPS